MPVMDFRVDLALQILFLPYRPIALRNETLHQPRFKRASVSTIFADFNPHFQLCFHSSSAGHYGGEYASRLLLARLLACLLARGVAYLPRSAAVCPRGPFRGGRYARFLECTFATPPPKNTPAKPEPWETSRYKGSLSPSLPVALRLTLLVVAARACCFGLPANLRTVFQFPCHSHKQWGKGCCQRMLYELCAMLQPRCFDGDGFCFHPCSPAAVSSLPAQVSGKVFGSKFSTFFGVDGSSSVRKQPRLPGQHFAAAMARKGEMHQTFPGLQASNSGRGFRVWVPTMGPNPEAARIPPAACSHNRSQAGAANTAEACTV